MHSPPNSIKVAPLTCEVVGVVVRVKAWWVGVGFAKGANNERRRQERAAERGAPIELRTSVDIS